MECSTSFEVVAEVLPLSPGSRTGSMCSASSSNAEGHPTVAVDMRQQATTLDPRPSTSSAALLVSLNDELAQWSRLDCHMDGAYPVHAGQLQHVPQHNTHRGLSRIQSPP